MSRFLTCWMAAVHALSQPAQVGGGRNAAGLGAAPSSMIWSAATMPNPLCAAWAGMAVTSSSVLLLAASQRAQGQPLAAEGLRRRGCIRRRIHAPRAQNAQCQYRATSGVGRQRALAVGRYAGTSRALCGKLLDRQVMGKSSSLSPTKVFADCQPMTAQLASLDFNRALPPE